MVVITYLNIIYQVFRPFVNTSDIFISQFAGGVKEKATTAGDNAVCRVVVVRAGCARAHAACRRSAHRAQPACTADAYRREAKLLFYIFSTHFGPVSHFKNLPFNHPLRKSERLAILAIAGVTTGC